MDLGGFNLVEASEEFSVSTMGSIAYVGLAKGGEHE